jgi:hypothetical protein
MIPSQFSEEKTKSRIIALLTTSCRGGSPMFVVEVQMRYMMDLISKKGYTRNRPLLSAARMSTILTTKRLIAPTLTWRGRIPACKLTTEFARA